MKKTTLIATAVAMGFPKATAEKLYANVPDDLTDPPQTEIDDAVKAFRQNQAELLKNDKDFVSAIKSEQYAIHSKQTISRLKKLVPDLTEDEIKDKDYKDILDLAFERSRKKGDKTSEELQAENVKLAAEIKKIREEEIPTIEGRVEQTRASLLTERELEKMVENLKQGDTPKKLRVGVKAAIATLKEKLAEQGVSYGLDDKGKLEFFTKTTDGQKLKVKNKDGTGFLSTEDLAVSVLDEEKLIENSGGGGGNGGGGNPPKKGDVEGGTEKEKKEELYKRFPHLAKAEQHKEELKETMAKNKDKKE